MPGNETSVYRTIDRLFAAGARVIYESSAGVHVSGHAAAEELKVMLNLVRPKYFMPVHGEHRHLYFHAELARADRHPRREHLPAGERRRARTDRRTAPASPGKVQAGMILVDGFAMGDFRDLVLRDRQHLATDGLVIVVVAAQRAGRQDRGRAGGGVPRASRTRATWTSSPRRPRSGWSRRCTRTRLQQVTDVDPGQDQVHDVLQKFLHKEAGRRPMVLPVIVEV